MLPVSEAELRVLSVAPVLALVEMTLIPGVTRSGCCSLTLVQAGSPVLAHPRDEKSASPWDSVPAPTPMTQLGSAYGLIVGLPGPSLPAAKKTATPASWTALVAIHIGLPSLQAEGFGIMSNGATYSKLQWKSVPQLFDTARMLYFAWFAMM